MNLVIESLNQKSLENINSSNCHEGSYVQNLFQREQFEEIFKSASTKIISDELTYDKHKTSLQENFQVIEKKCPKFSKD